jgi:hypothetical protein
MSRGPEGWRSTERRRGDGAIDSEQRALAARPVVELSDGGARLLGRCYWLEVTRASRGLVRCDESDDGVEVRLLGLRPPLLTLGRAQVAVDGDRVSCSYPIRGGLLARRAGGALRLAQLGRERPELCVGVSGFFARLSVRPGLPRWSGALYEQLQRRAHVALSRRYLRRLIAERPQ